jgi:AcrR family transcriptional regulator
LREQHHQLTRELILRSVVEQLEQGELSEITMQDVARGAGVSLRTVYRHFPTREELLAAASEWIAEKVFSDPRIPESLDEIVRRAGADMNSFDERPNLVRAMAVTRAGNAVRSVRRVQRLEKLHRALAEVTGNLTATEQRQAEAVFGYLVNMLAWVTMRDENGFSGEQTSAALRWALETLVDDLRRRNEAAALQQARQGPATEEASDGA